jgi:phosphotransferase system HPr-like phosphotransfer protein
MFEKIIKCNVTTIEKVKIFVDLNNNFDGDVTVVYGRYVIDGKSIMGMFSLDLSNTLSVTIESNSEKDIDLLIDSYKKYNI